MVGNRKFGKIRVASGAHLNGRHKLMILVKRPIYEYSTAATR